MKSTRHVIRAQVIALFGAMVIAACGGGASDSSTPSVTVAEPSAEDSDAGAPSDRDVVGTEPGAQVPGAGDVATVVAVASARLIDDKVDFRTGVQSEFASLIEPVDVAVGDVVRTDVSGFGEITYFEGSITRLDVDTEFEITSLVDDPGNTEIRTRMGLGRTWHRVEDLTGDDTYAVETSVATATVRGTAFTITCVSETECRFDVFEGTVEVELPDGAIETIDAPGTLVVDAAGEPADPEPDVATNEWIDRNVALDTGVGFPDLILAGTGTTEPPGGIYDAVVTVNSYYNPIPSNPTPPVESQTPLQFTGVCDGVGPCSLVLDENTFFLDISLIDLVKVGQMTLNPLGGGSYDGSLIEPESEFCPIVTTAEFEVTLTETSMTATFSHVPDTREVLIFSEDGRNQCWSSTFDLTLTGTRPV